jgi:hypothetical protein
MHSSHEFWSKQLTTGLSIVTTRETVWCKSLSQSQKTAVVTRSSKKALAVKAVAFAFAASAATIYCRFSEAINHNVLNRKVAKLRGHGTSQGVRRNIETAYTNKLVIWRSETKKESSQIIIPRLVNIETSEGIDPVMRFLGKFSEAIKRGMKR